MSAIQITNIVCSKNQGVFRDPIELEIYFEVYKEIKNVYIGCANDQKYDQILEKFSMGPFTQLGSMQFSIQAEAPDFKNIPSKDDLLGVTAMILSASYKKQEFFRCGFYVYNCYNDQELIEIDTPETPIQIDKVSRNILTDKPRITRFEIQWDESLQESTQESSKQQDSNKENSISQMKQLNAQQAKQEFKYSDYINVSGLIMNDDEQNNNPELQKEYVQKAIFDNSNGFDRDENVLQYKLSFE